VTFTNDNTGKSTCAAMLIEIKGAISAAWRLDATVFHLSRGDVVLNSITLVSGNEGGSFFNLASKIRGFPKLEAITTGYSHMMRGGLL
jgi:hypothetical protein